MQGDINKPKAVIPEEPDMEVSPRFSETLAAYFEQRNSGQSTEAILQKADDEARQALSLIQLTDQMAQDMPEITKAWQTFRERNFAVVPATLPQAASLGGYVIKVLESDAAVKASGLPRTTLEAMQQDSTPLTSLRNFELADHAALAKRHGVKDTLFPRMLKWLKNVGKSFSAPAYGNSGSRGMLFAREDGFRYQLSEAELAEELKAGQPDKTAEQDKPEE